MLRAADLSRYAAGALRGFRLRSALMVLAMAMGVTAVILLTALGEGARQYVVGQFASLGSHLLIVVPGRNETGGAGVAMAMGATPRELTLNDALALTRHAAVRRVAPLVVGSALVAAGGLEREVPVLGSTAELLAVRHWTLAQGRFLPAGDPSLASPVCVIGAKVRRELFGARPALGQWLRVADRRCRVIGILAPEGRSIGVDVEELVIIPVASAQQLYDTGSLFRILIETRSREDMEAVKSFVRRILTERHQGEEDFTIVTQDAVLGAFDDIFRALTLSVAGIAAISLGVAGILVMNVMLIAVAQRTTEIGLLRAIGASGRMVSALFLAEAALLALTGAALGLMLGLTGSWALGRLAPALAGGTPAWALAGSVGIALATGLLFGWLPARRAARLDPILALAKH